MTDYLKAPTVTPLCQNKKFRKNNYWNYYYELENCKKSEIDEPEIDEPINNNLKITKLKRLKKMEKRKKNQEIEDPKMINYYRENKRGKKNRRQYE